MKNSKEDLDIIKLLSSKDWQTAYKNFAYQNCIIFQDNTTNVDQQKELFKKFQDQLGPIANTVLSKEVQEQQKKNIKQLQKNNPHELIVQLLSLYDFQIFQNEMISQNQLLDLIALELIRKEVRKEENDSSSDDEEGEQAYLEQQREQKKQQVEGKVNLEEEKQKLEKTIRDTIQNFNLPEVIKLPDVQVDQLGFNQGVLEKEDDVLKKSIKLRTLKLKQQVPKKEIKLTADQIKKRKLQMDLIRKAMQDQ